MGPNGGHPTSERECPATSTDHPRTECNVPQEAKAEKEERSDKQALDSPKLTRLRHERRSKPPRSPHLGFRLLKDKRNPSRRTHRHTRKPQQATKGSVLQNKEGEKDPRPASQRNSAFPLTRRVRRGRNRSLPLWKPKSQRIIL